MLYMKGAKAVAEECFKCWATDILDRKKKEHDEAMADLLADEEALAAGQAADNKAKTMRMLVDKNSEEGKKILLASVVRAWNRGAELTKAARKKQAHIDKMQKLLEDRRAAKTYEFFVETFGLWKQDWTLSRDPADLRAKIAVAQEAFDLSKSARKDVVGATEDALERTLAENDRQYRLAEQTRGAEQAMRAAEAENAVLHKKEQA